VIEPVRGLAHLKRGPSPYRLPITSRPQHSCSQGGGRTTRAGPDWKDKAVSPEDAVTHIKSGMKIFVHGTAATPTPLLTALCKRLDLADVHLCHLHVSGDIPLADSSQSGRFFSTSLFTAPALRKPIEEGPADFMPIFLRDILRRSQPSSNL